MYAASNWSQESDMPGNPAGAKAICANCDIEIRWSPTIVQGKTYCCTGCAAGGPCSCDYSQYRSVRIAGVIHYMPEHEEQHSSPPGGM
jgi:hypothetical protein